MAGKEKVIKELKEALDSLGITNKYRLNLIRAIEYLQEEPVIKELSEEIDYLSKRYPEVSFAKLSRIAVHVANWQKEQFEKNRLAACDKQTEEEAEIERDFVMGIIENEHRQPTFDDAIKYGMRLQKEQMMKEAVEAAVNTYEEIGGKGYVEFVANVPVSQYKGEHGVKIIIIEEN